MSLYQKFDTKLLRLIKCKTLFLLIFASVAPRFTLYLQLVIGAIYRGYLQSLQNVKIKLENRPVSVIYRDEKVNNLFSRLWQTYRLSNYNHTRNINFSMCRNETFWYNVCENFFFEKFPMYNVTSCIVSNAKILIIKLLLKI